MSEAIELIKKEREKQKDLSWTAGHDDTEVNDELARAAATYALPADRREVSIHQLPSLWPWAGWWNPTPDDRVKELVKAGALIVAEIERLQRI